jgi:hypothetical protein
VNDNTELMYLNDASLLWNLRCRYLSDSIYTYTGYILIAINPYKDINGLYGEEAMGRFVGRGLLNNPPHIYAIAEEAVRKARHGAGSQSLIISGESGAGKTETNKLALRYIVWRARGEGDRNAVLSRRILQANPLLELRSGSPHTTSTASLSKLLSPGTTVSGLAMAYKYETGYGDKGNASCGVSFSVSVGGKAAYSSPVMTEFPFSRRKDPSAYSPPVSVDARGLGVPITGGGNRKVEFEFTNDCRNVQLLLPLVRQSSRAPARPRPHRCCVPPRVHIRSYIPFRAHTR